MADPLRSITVWPTLAVLVAQPGELNAVYSLPLDQPHVYEWIPNSLAVADGLAVLTKSGGNPGAHHMLVADDKGADLDDTDEALVVGDGFYRRVVTNLTRSAIKTLSTTNAKAGMVVHIVSDNTAAFTLAIANGGIGAGTLKIFASATPSWADCRYDGTNWELIRFGTL